MSKCHIAGKLVPRLKFQYDLKPCIKSSRPKHQESDINGEGEYILFKVQ